MIHPQKKIVLFGGIDFVGPLNDTWEWDGTEWSQVADIGPPPRTLHKMVYNADDNRMVLFGGRNNTVSMNDTWEWDGTEWSQVADTGPPPRTWHKMVYNADDNKMYCLEVVTIQ